MKTPGFDGFKGAQSFFAELGKHNNKAWFTAQKERYETVVLEPAEVFVLTLKERLSDTYPDLGWGTQRNGAGSIMRIHRDVRFSKDKRPYKENLGLIFWFGEGRKVERPCFYFHLDPGRVFFYGGMHLFPKEFLEPYREAVADDRTGEELETILSTLEESGLSVFEEPEYKRVPSGYPADHPRGELLKMKGLGVGADFAPATVDSADLVDQCVGHAVEMAPLIGWLRRVDAGNG